jgi:adenylate kinase
LAYSLDLRESVLSSAAGVIPGRGSIPAVILFGSPGSGKGTQAKLLRQTCVAGPHISTGDMLRHHIEAADEIGLEIQQLMKSGRLVPDELVNRLVEVRVQNQDCQAGIILDGYPRTLAQAGVLLDLLRDRGMVPVVVHLMVDYEKIVARLSGRRQCPVCGTLYSVSTNPPKVAGKCDLDGTSLVTRDDDREDVIRERLRQYELQTQPLLEFFSKAGVRIFEIAGGSADPASISGNICRFLDSAKSEDSPKVSGR